MSVPAVDEIQEAAVFFEGKPPREVLAWAIERYRPGIALACSFGAEDVVLVDMVSRIRPDAKIFYLDTDLFFPETYAVRDRLRERYNANLIRFSALKSLSEQESEHGPELWRREPDLCCQIRKMEPLARALGDLDAWITGIRRDQAPARAQAKAVEWDAKFGLVKINPLVRWTWQEIWDYIREHDVPYNELHDRGYPSIGCAPCTREIKSGEDSRAGRWSGFQKTECGLHG